MGLHGSTSEFEARYGMYLTQNLVPNFHTRNHSVLPLSLMALQLAHSGRKTFWLVMYTLLGRGGKAVNYRYFQYI